MIYAYVCISIVVFIWILLLNRREQTPFWLKVIWAALWPITAVLLLFICVYLLWGKRR